MTRIAGTLVVKTSCCGALYSKTSFASVNFSAQEYWTDGRSVMSLFPNDGGLRRCNCGTYFLLHECEVVQSLPNRPYRPRAPKGWQNTKDNWWRRFWGKPNLGDYLLNYDIRSDKEIETEELGKPPCSVTVSESNLSDVIEMSKGNVLSQTI